MQWHTYIAFDLSKGTRIWTLSPAGFKCLPLYSIVTNQPWDENKPLHFAWLWSVRYPELKRLAQHT